MLSIVAAGRRAAAPGVRCGPVVGRALLPSPLSSTPPTVMIDRVLLLLAAAAASSSSAAASSVVIPHASPVELRLRVGPRVLSEKKELR